MQSLTDFNLQEAKYENVFPQLSFKFLHQAGILFLQLHKIIYSLRKNNK
jgi:hypothetical protein